MSEQKRAKFGSKLGMILATAGGAVGLGNVWRFPYMAGQNGGAAFILIYIGCILLLGLPCMISEFIIGRHAASNTARAYTKLSNGSAWKWVGYLGVLTGFLITGLLRCRFGLVFAIWYSLCVESSSRYTRLFQVLFYRLLYQPMEASSMDSNDSTFHALRYHSWC